MRLKNKLVNVHIPKTAGSSLRANLSVYLASTTGRKTQVIGIDRPSKSGGYFSGLRAGFQQRLPEILDDGMQVMSGHYRYRDIADLLAPLRDQVSLISFVRDPVWRTLSDYFYSISDAHASRDAFVATYPRFDDYLKIPGQMNKIQDFLCPYVGAPVCETVQSAVSNFDFIGVTENFNNDFKVLMTALGADFEPRLHKNTNPDRGPMLEAHAKYHDRLQEILVDEYTVYHAILKHRNISA